MAGLLFGPGSLLYESYGDRLGYLCAGATGLMQLMYPPLGRGVEQHSDFYDEPLERLFRSVPQIMRIIFDGDVAPTQAHRVRDFHSSIKGDMPDGERYTSDTAEGNPRWVPLWTLGWPVQADGARDSLAITGGSVRIGDDGIAIRRPLPQPAWPAGAGTWVRDSCHALPLAEACARLRDRRDAKTELLARALAGGFTPAEVEQLREAAPLLERLAQTI